MKKLQQALLRTTLGILAAMSLGLSSCSDDETNTPTEATNYWPSKTGNQWVFSTVELDTTTAQPIPGTEDADSVWVTGQTSVSGTPAAVFSTVTLSDDDEEEDSTIFAVINNSLFNYSESISPSAFFAIDDDAEPVMGWLKWADFSNRSWSYDSVIPLTDLLEEEIPGVGPVLLRGSGSIKFEGSAGAIENVVITRGTGSADDTTVRAQRYNSKITVTLNVTTQPSVPGVTFDPIRLEIPSTLWLANNIGLVRQRSEPFRLLITASIASQRNELQSIRFPGSEQTLVRYRVIP